MPERQEQAPTSGDEVKQDATTVRPSTEPAQEWGERLDTGRAIQRGGKTSGPTPGAQESPPAADEEE